MRDTGFQGRAKEAPVAESEDVLGRAPLFEALDEEGTQALRAGVQDVKLGRGDRVFDEGDEGDQLYVVLEGKIKLTRTAPDGRENLLSVLGPGEMFGELSLFDPRPRTSSAVAVTDAHLAGLGHDYLRHWLTGRPDVAMHLLRAWRSGCAAPTTSWPTWCSPTCRGAWPRRCWTWRTGSGRSRTAVSRCTTTSPRRNWRNSSARHGKP